jgi:ParB/RepB/Spo0J family partition protein
MSHRWICQRETPAAFARRRPLAWLQCARVRDLTDAEVLEVQFIENLQREDVHPLEESEGFAQLLKRPNYTAEVLANKIGHDAAYVYKRLQLAALIKPARGGIPIRTDQPGPRSITGTSARRQTEGRLR